MVVVVVVVSATAEALRENGLGGVALRVTSQEVS